MIVAAHAFKRQVGAPGTLSMATPAFVGGKAVRQVVKACLSHSCAFHPRVGVCEGVTLSEPTLAKRNKKQSGTRDQEGFPVFGIINISSQILFVFPDFLRPWSKMAQPMLALDWRGMTLSPQSASESL